MSEEIIITAAGAPSQQVVTFGCRLNAYESEVIRQNIAQSGLQDVVVFNTCAVTAEAERQARQAIRKARRENPGVKIIVTGCSAQVKAAEYAAMPEVDLVLGNEEKLKAESYPRADADFGIGETEKVSVNDIMGVKETALHLVSGFEGKARAFVQVQNGCNHRCTFCIIPYGRGNSRSVPLGEIVQQIRALVEAGYREVVLTGVDITDYGKDLPGTPTLGQICRRLLALVPELPRLRLSSLDPVEVDEDLFRLFAEEPRLMPHVHISLQAGDDMVLKRMKRRHLRQDVLDFCARLRTIRPDVVFGADIIAGFPTETDEMFDNTLRLVEEAGLTFLHVFPYSSREGTPAAKMPQVLKAVRKHRAAQLREAGDAAVQRYLASRIGATERVLIEEEGRGRTEHFALVELASLSAALTPGEVVQTVVTGVKAEHLIGTLAP